MKYSVTFVCCLAFLVAPSIGSGIERPELLGNYLKLNTGEYLYAEDNPSLDFELKDNFAIEFWFKVESVPGLPFQQRVLLTKLGSYAFVIRVDTEFFSRQGFPLPSTFHVLRLVGIADGGAGTDASVISVDPGDWCHVAYETWKVGNTRHDVLYINGEKKRRGRGTPGGAWCADTDNRFYIGDVPQEALEGLTEINFPYDPLVSAPIHMDEVRLSVAPIGEPQIDVRPDPNAKTMALWHFDEGPNAARYRDDAGANTLFRQSLSVSANRALATTWGRLKSLGF